MEPNFDFELESRNIHSMANYGVKQLVDFCVDVSNDVDEVDRKFLYYVVACRPKKCPVRKRTVAMLESFKEIYNLKKAQTKLF